jgi:hypothetical protein
MFDYETDCVGHILPSSYNPQFIKVKEVLDSLRLACRTFAASGLQPLRWALRLFSYGLTFPLWVTKFLGSTIQMWQRKWDLSPIHFVAEIL